MFFTTLADARHYRRWHQPKGARVVKCRRWRWTDHTMNDGYWEHGYTVVLK